MVPKFQLTQSILLALLAARLQMIAWTSDVDPAEQKLVLARPMPALAGCGALPAPTRCIRTCCHNLSTHMHTSAACRASHSVPQACPASRCSTTSSPGKVLS